MLVLTRKVNQQIRLGDSITVTVLRVQGNSIRIGIEAPREVRVVRGELGAIEPATSEYDSEAADQTSASIEVTESLPSWMPMGGMLEFELDGLDAETIENAIEEAAAVSDACFDDETERPQIYQMKTSAKSGAKSAAPLSRFFPPSVRETSSSYTD